MLGLNHNVKNVPVNNKTTKLHNAISPNMNDQWSGNTLRICFLLTAARPVRSSAQVASPATGLPRGVLAAFLPFVVTVLIIDPHVPSSWVRPARRSHAARRGIPRRPPSGEAAATGEQPVRTPPYRCRPDRTSTDGRGTAGGGSAAPIARSG